MNLQIYIYIYMNVMENNYRKLSWNGDRVSQNCNVLKTVVHPFPNARSLMDDYLPGLNYLNWSFISTLNFNSSKIAYFSSLCNMNYYKLLSFMLYAKVKLYRDELNSASACLQPLWTLYLCKERKVVSLHERLSKITNLKKN